jgi:hypothetical protein
MAVLLAAFRIKRCYWGVSGRSDSTAASKGAAAGGWRGGDGVTVHGKRARRTEFEPQAHPE